MVDAVRHCARRFARTRRRSFDNPGDEAEPRIGDDDVGVFPEGLRHHVASGGYFIFLPPPEFARERRIALDQLQRAPMRLPRAASSEMRLEPGDRRLDRVAIVGRNQRRTQTLGEIGDMRLEIQDAGAARRDDRDHRTAELARQFLCIQDDPAPLGDVHHIDGDQHRRAHLQQLRREIEIALQIGGVDDVHDQAGLARENKIARDPLVLGYVDGRAQRVDAWQVDHLI